MKDEEFGVDLSDSHILVVDDNARNLQVIGNILKQYDYRLQFALSGGKVFDALLQTKADLILMDIKMPDMDGYEVCRRLRESEEYADIPVIFVTAAYKDEESIAKGFDAGAVDYITKPFFKDELVARVRTHLRLKKYQEYLRDLSRIDPLTRLHNRRAMVELLESEQRRSGRNRSPYALVMADIDRFKSINDRYGHNCGDAVLAGAASILRERARKSDRVCRWGGEEFLLLLPDTDAGGAAALAESLRAAAAAATFSCEGISLRATMTFGATVCGWDVSTDEGIRKADAALYAGKTAGRNRVVLYPDIPVPQSD